MQRVESLSWKSLQKLVGFGRFNGVAKKIPLESLAASRSRTGDGGNVDLQNGAEGAGPQGCAG